MVMVKGGDCGVIVWCEWCDDVKKKKKQHGGEMMVRWEEVVEMVRTGGWVDQFTMVKWRRHPLWKRSMQIVIKSVRGVLSISLGYDGLTCFDVYFLLLRFRPVNFVVGLTSFPLLKSLSFFWIIHSLLLKCTRSSPRFRRSLDTKIWFFLGIYGQRGTYCLKTLIWVSSDCGSPVIGCGRATFCCPANKHKKYFFARVLCG